MTKSKMPSSVDDRMHVYQDKRGEWRWQRKASNGKIVGASSEGYNDRRSAMANARRVQTACG